ncbi:hypothetical protein GLE_1231 [Lysobacter enzymogenes]|uniref:Uncharacterized protein n=1 Tax=Lysobacter enzymogenes TaxID=69 RepID=A0A0S2DDG6_LYSEN|nr:hypothetical protein GLE_1231 [Lysobacter enzymogenes]
MLGAGRGAGHGGVGRREGGCDDPTAVARRGGNDGPAFAHAVT